MTLFQFYHSDEMSKVPSLEEMKMVIISSDRMGYNVSDLLSGGQKSGKEEVKYVKEWKPPSSKCTFNIHECTMVNFL